MSLTRRSALLGLLAVAGACTTQTGSAPSAQTTWRRVANPGWDAWVAAFRGRAAGQGISEATLARAFAGAGYLPGVVERDRNQTEFSRTTEDYLAIVANEARVREGRAELARRGAVLDQIEARYNVDKAVVVAIWGVESRYGTRRGTVPVISALSTLAYDGRRGPFFEQQLTGALRILQNGDTTPERMVGSWAGAMGHTQFIPTSYLAYAVDFNGDGRRDIWSEDPTDALASAANYLRRFGWRKGQPWGVEVQAPAGAPTGARRSPAAWTSAGVRLMNGRPVPDFGTARLLRPAGPSGPAFLAFHNFTVLTRYNNAVNYVIGVGHLSDRLNGQGPIQGRFPRDAQGLSIEDRKRLQERLNARGYDLGEPDGVIGSKTIAAIEAYERANGLPVTGVANRALLERLG